MTEQVLLTTDRDGVRTLTLNRPERKNAIMRNCGWSWPTRCAPPPVTMSCARS